MNCQISITVLILSILLFGCATSTGVRPAGPDTYTITTDSRVGGVSAIKKKGIHDAKAYCASSGKKLRTVRPPTLSTHKNFFGNENTTYTLIFRCLATGDED